MKKYLLLFAIILPFLFTSCGDDKDEPQNLEQELIGGWSYKNDSGETFIYNYKSDHTGTLDVYNPDLSLAFHDPFTWTLEGNFLTVSFGEEDSLQS